MQETLAEIRSKGGEAEGYRVDVTNKEQIAAMVKSVMAKSGRIDCVVNNAGIVMDAQLKSMTDEQYYTKVAEEIDRGQIRPGLWTKAMAQCGSNTAQIRATYIKLRVESLRAEIAARLSELSEEPENRPKPGGSAAKVVVDCPHCSLRLRVASGKDLRVKCSKCGHEFGAKT
jgi:short chain dehydrogenase